MICWDIYIQENKYGDNKSSDLEKIMKNTVNTPWQFSSSIPSAYLSGVKQSLTP